MKNLLKNFVTIISVFLLAVIHFGSPTSAKDLVIMTSLPSMEFPFFVHMQKQLDQEARRIGGIKIMAADGQNRVPKQTADVEAAIIQGESFFCRKSQKPRPSTWTCATSRSSVTGPRYLFVVKNLVNVKLVGVDGMAAIKVVDNPDVTPAIVTLFDVLYIP